MLDVTSQRAAKIQLLEKSAAESSDALAAGKISAEEALRAQQAVAEK